MGDRAPEEILGLGGGVALVRVLQKGRPAGSSGHVEQQRGWVILWVQGKIERVAIYLDIDEARAA